MAEEDVVVDFQIKGGKKTKISTATTETKQEDKDKQLVKMFCVDLGPYYILGYNGFREFIANNIPNYELPSMEEFTGKLIPGEYNRVRFDFKKTLNLVHYVAISIDTWKLPATERRCDYSLWTATVHFVHQGKLVSQNLFTIDANLRSARKVFESMKKELEKWALLKKVVCFVTYDGDNEQLLKDAVVNLKLPVVPCIAANINRIIEESLKTFRSRDIEKKYNKNRSDATKLTKQKDGLFSWHYLYGMLENISENRAGDFNADERGVFSEYFKILKPFVDFSNTLSSEQYITLSYVIPLLADVKLQISECSVSTDLGIAFKEKFMDWTVKMLYAYENTDITPNATFLDPRFKKKYFTPERAESVQQNVSNELNEYKNTIIPQTSEKDISVLFYVAEPPLDKKEDPFHYWEDFNRNQKSTVNLYVLSQKYLCIPAAAIPVQTINGKFLWNKNDDPKITNYYERRTELDYKNISQILFLHSYYSNET